MCVALLRGGYAWGMLCGVFVCDVCAGFLTWHLCVVFVGAAFVRVVELQLQLQLQP